MVRYILHRLLQTLIVVIIVSFLTFLLMHLIPGDPVRAMLGEHATPDQIELIRQELGLDRPFVAQYAHWLINLFQGNWGRSIIYRDNVAEMILTRLPITFHIGLIAIIISIIIGIPAGIISAIRRGSSLDSVITVMANLGVSIPIFWLGIVGIYLFSLKLGWFPVQGYTSPFTDFWLSTKQVFMPSICSSVLTLSVLTRQTRSNMLEIIHQDFIRTARSKGLKKNSIIIGHALKNALIPVITLLGVYIPVLLGGSVLIETVFNIPGLGRLLVTSVFNNDFPVVQGCVLTSSLLVTLSNLAVDISYGFLDPRIRND